MKKILTLTYTLLIGATLIAQQAIPFKGKVNTHSITQSTSESSNEAQKTGPYAGNGTQMSTTSASILHSLPNAYGYGTFRGQKQITAYPELNTVAFANRSNPAVFGGTSNDLRYVISTDAGDTWSNSMTVGGIINPNGSLSGMPRYPNAILFSNGNTLSDLKMHVTAPTIAPGTSTWDSQVHITVQNPSNVLANTSQEDYNFTGMGIFQSSNITERVHNSGEFWMICNSATVGNDSFYVCKGIYDSLTQKLNWTIHDKLLGNWNTTVDGAAHYTTAKIAFSTDGTKGFVAALGDLVGGRDSIYQPVFWNYNNNGHFLNGTEYEIDINAGTALQNYVLQWVDSNNVPIANATGGKVTTSFDFDLTVDMNGIPHFFTIIGPAAVDGTPYSISSGFGLREIDIRLNGGLWYATEIAKQLCFRETVGTSPSDLAIDPAPMLSRSVDGKYIFYTWTDTDTTGGGGSTDNTAPDFWGRMVDVSTNLGTDSINWTLNDPNWHTKSRIAKTSEYVFEATSTSACGKKLEVPTTILNFTDITNVQTTCEVIYFTDILYDCADAVNAMKMANLFLGTGISNTNDFQNLRIYPNPAKDRLTLQLQLAKAEKLTISLTNLNGQVLLSKNIENTQEVNESFDISKLASGMYFLQINSKNGTQSQKVIIE